MLTSARVVFDEEFVEFKPQRSRGTGAAVCDHYSKLAFSQFPDLPSELKRLAWLSLDSQEGQEYWNAMELMGQYAAANHACIHRHIAAHLGAQVLLDLENHHNFAWKERHGGREVIVHRKGATPAGKGVRMTRKLLRVEWALTARMMPAVRRRRTPQKPQRSTPI